MLIRTDAAGGSQAFLGHLDQQGLAYSVGLPVTWQIGEIASTLGEDIKQGIIRPDGTVSDTTDAYVADITSRMHSWAGEPLGINLDKYPTDMRIIIRVEHPARGAQLRITDVDGRRVQAFVTTGQGMRTDSTRSTGPGAGASNASGISRTAAWGNSRTRRSG